MTTTDSLSRVKTYHYDNLNRPTSITYSDGTPSVAFAYDNLAAGANTYNTRRRLLSISNANSTTNYTSYDVQGNVLASNQQTNGQTYSFSYTYNLAGDLVSETNVKTNRTLTTSYDNIRRPTALSGAVGASPTNYISQAAYSVYGLPWYYVRGNNVWHVQSYNTRMQPTESYEAVNNSQSSYLFISCPNWGQDSNHYGTYNTCPHYSGTNDNGTLQSYQESHGGAGYSSLLVFNDVYQYDNVNRLYTATDRDASNTMQWARTFNYDQWGDMWDPNPYGNPFVGNTPTTNVYTGNNKNQDGRWSYDAAGNLLTVNGNTASYNAENQIVLLSATANGGGAETLYYDGVGQRVQKTIAGTGGSTTNYFYDAFGQLAAESVNGSWSRDYIRDGAGNLIATENASGPCTTCYFAYDHLGSVRLVMDQNAAVVGRHDYLPFGEDVSGNAGRTGPGFHLPGTVAMDAAQQFTGQVRDQEAGQDYFNARYFTPPQGRFNSVDPGNAGADFTSSQSWNGYGYVLGNPLNAVDPSGTRWVTFQVQVCTPSISSTIVYYTLPSGSSNGTTSACHSVPMEIWVDDNPPVISIGGGSGPGGAGRGGGGGGASTQGPPKNQPCPNGYSGAGLTYGPSVRTQHRTAPHEFPSQRRWSKDQAVHAGTVFLPLVANITFRPSAPPIRTGTW